MSLAQKNHIVQIIGHLGGDPTMRYTPSGAAVTSFSVASSNGWTDDAGEKHQVTTWWKITAWNKKAEVCNMYLKKGSKVLIEGEITVDPATGGPRIWTAADGTPRASLEIKMEDILFLDKKPTGEDGSSGGSASANSPSPRQGQGQRQAAPPTGGPAEEPFPPINDDDIPF